MYNGSYWYYYWCIARPGIFRYIGSYRVGSITPGRYMADMRHYKVAGR